MNHRASAILDVSSIIFFQLVPVSCATCKKNYCLRHRHENDHECVGVAAASSNRYFELLIHEFSFFIIKCAIIAGQSAI